MGRRKKVTRTAKTPFEAVDKTEWEVEAVKAKRWAKGSPQYEVKWKDHDEKQNTWEPLENLVGAERSIADFEAAWEKNYNAPRRESHKRLREGDASTPLEQAQAEAAGSLDDTCHRVTNLADALSGATRKSCQSTSSVSVC